MGLRFASGKWHLAAVVMVTPLLGVGYYAGNPENLGFTVHAALSGVGSVHGQQTPLPGSEIKRKTIAREAEHLFAAPVKGPRADRYMEFTRSRKGLEPETKIAARPVQADMMVTGSLPGPQPQKIAALSGETKVSRRPASVAYREEDYGLPPAVPFSERSSASLFLSSLASSNPVRFPEFSNAPDKTPPEGPTAISRGLNFKGETEVEYQARQRRCLATAIYFEARGESKRGQLAVAQVVMNRVRSTLYPDTICGVVYQGQRRRTGCQFSFTCDGIADVPRDKVMWRQANLLARQVTKGDTWLGDIGYATNYHANYVKPRWRREMSRIKQVGKHIFYRVRAKQINDVLSD
ncbi:MAG TPA: cell wall hydrolase, partial [Rhizobiales bacterium]|nr:cell wall hydrolase [Hyphomicrobiales bacterium]